MPDLDLDAMERRAHATPPISGDCIFIHAERLAVDVLSLVARVRELELQLGLRDSCEMATTAVRLEVAPATAAVALEALTGGHVLRGAVADLRSIKSDLDNCRVEEGGAVVRDQK